VLRAAQRDRAAALNKAKQSNHYNNPLNGRPSIIRAHFEKLAHMRGSC